MHIHFINFSDCSSFDQSLIIELNATPTTCITMHTKWELDGDDIECSVPLIDYMIVRITVA